MCGLFRLQPPENDYNFEINTNVITGINKNVFSQRIPSVFEFDITDAKWIVVNKARHTPWLAAICRSSSASLRLIKLNTNLDSSWWGMITFYPADSIDNQPYWNNSLNTRSKLADGMRFLSIERADISFCRGTVNWLCDIFFRLLGDW